MLSVYKLFPKVIKVDTSRQRVKTQDASQKKVLLWLPLLIYV